ncbi:MAG: hypothetical protein M0R80_04195 [Proteobacteria bacterium]|jgi:hypothetical protein|nr:hypothetical protein [Pseudomonadota bacterium]
MSINKRILNNIADVMRFRQKREKEEFLEQYKNTIIFDSLDMNNLIDTIYQSLLLDFSLASNEELDNIISILLDDMDQFDMTELNRILLIDEEE